MKNWFLPIAVLGISGVGLVCSTERGREQMRNMLNRWLEHGDPLGEFNHFLEDRLGEIQQALDSLSEALEEPQT
jgi:hypothetical protein